MKAAVHAEWTKLRTSSEAIALVCVVALSARWIEVGQAVVAVLAVMSNGMAGPAFTAVPRRWKVLVAKAIVLGGVVAAAGAWRGLESVLYLMLIAMLGLGVVAMVRNEAAAVGAVLGLLYLFPILALSMSDPDWQRRLQQIGPMTAGLSFQTTGGPHGPWQGLGVLALWGAGALVAGAICQARRDV